MAGIALTSNLSRNSLMPSTSPVRYLGLSDIVMKTRAEISGAIGKSLGGVKSNKILDAVSEGGERGAGVG